MSADEEESNALLIRALTASALFVVALVLGVGSIWFRNNRVFDALCVARARSCCGDGEHLYRINIASALLMVILGILLLVDVIPMRNLRG